jgi:protein gp37
MSKRLQAMGTPGYENGFTDIQTHESRLEIPLKRKKATTYFVNSMSDLFHELVPIDFIDKVMATIDNAPQHNFQILSKRAVLMREYFAKHRTPPVNCWIGVSVEDQKYGLPRIEHLREINATVRFLSIEPLLEDLGELDLTGIHWVIVGGESGNKARPMQTEWVDSIQRQCVAQNVPFFFKQWGAWGPDGIKRKKQLNGRLLHGEQYDQMPTPTSSLF